MVVQRVRYSIFKTRFGWVGLVGVQAGLLCLILPGQKSDTSTRIKERFSDRELILDPPFFDETAAKIVDYFEGREIAFNDNLELSGSSPFQRSIWRVTQKIHYGHTRSYLWVARQAKTSPRAVGQALKKNPLPIVIPCHRVIRDDGTLGGYLSGLDWKKRLLSLEKRNV